MELFKNLNKKFNLNKIDTEITNKYNQNEKKTNEILQCTNEEKKTFTIEEAIDKLGFGIFQIKLLLIAGFAFMADSMEIMALSILGPLLSCDWFITKLEKALITTVVFVGIMVSSTLWGKLCDNYGRKTGLLLCSVFTFYFGLLSSFAPNYIWFLVLRFLVGFGVGGVTQSFTLYAEFSPPKYRRISSLINFFWPVGGFFEVLLAMIVVPTLGWRYLLGFTAIPILIFGCSFHWLPESFRFHLTHGKEDLAMDTLRQIAKENKKELPEGKLAFINNCSKKGSFFDLLSKEHRCATLILWMIWFCNGFCYYGLF